MTLDIPSPKDLKEKVEEEDLKKTENATNFVTALLEEANIATLLMESKGILYTQKDKVKKTIKTTAADLAKAELDLMDLIKPIKEILGKYNVIVEENKGDFTLSLTISIPKEFFVPNS